MKSEELNAVVRWCLTNTEKYSKEKPSDEAVKLRPHDDYWLVVTPDRVNPGELFADSAEHRELRIGAWQGFAAAFFKPAT